MIKYVSRFKWFILHRIHPQHRYHVVNTNLPPGYYDPCVQILHATMEPIRRFVERGAPQIEWSADEGHKHTKIILDQIYDWWVYQYPQYEIEEDDILERWSNCFEANDPNGEVPIFPLSIKEGMEERKNELSEQLRELEIKREHDIQTMLCKAAEIRPFLWYP